MTAEDASVRKTGGNRLLNNRVDVGEDAAAVEGSSAQIRDLLTMSLTSKMDYVSSMQASYVPPKGPGGRQRGSRAEFLEKILHQKISEKVLVEFGPAPRPKPDYISTSQKDFCVQGFVPAAPETTGHDYKTDQTVSFWSENTRRVQVGYGQLPLMWNNGFYSSMLTSQEEKVCGFYYLGIPTTLGMTTTGALDSPFKKSSLFSTPITQRLDEPALPPDT